MTSKLSLPPLRDLPHGHLEERKEHLLAEIARQGRPALIFPKRLPRPRSSRLLRPWFVAAVSVLAAVLTLAGLLVIHTGTSPASAADVRAKLAHAVGRAQSIRGEFTVVTRPVGPLPHHRMGCSNCYPAVPIPSKFVIGTDGSYAEEAAGTQRTLGGPIHVSTGIAYNAATGIQTSYERGEVKGRVLYAKATHIDPAWRPYSPEAQLAAFVAQALAARSPRVHDTTFDGRTAWSLTLRFTPGDDFYDTYGVRVDVVVDRTTGLVLQVTQYAEAPTRWTSIESIRNLKIGAPTTASDFSLAIPAGARVVTHDYGFRRVPVSRAPAIVGYRPLLPTLTGGRPLVDFAVARTSDQQLVPGLSAPRYRDVVSARYGRGLDSFVVSTRRGRASDLPELFQGISAHTITLTRGPLRGAIAYLRTSPPGYLAVFRNGLVVQVTAPSANQTVAIASSLAATK
jgi:hypothetical protein